MFLVLSICFEYCANNVPVKYFIFVQSLEIFWRRLKIFLGNIAKD